MAVLEFGGGDVDNWLAENARQVEWCQQVLSEISHVEKPYYKLSPFQALKS